MLSKLEARTCSWPASASRPALPKRRPRCSPARPLPACAGSCPIGKRRMAIEISSPSNAAIVRLMPSIATEASAPSSPNVLGRAHLSVQSVVWLWKLGLDAGTAGSSAVNAPVPSTCPCTICPPRGLPAAVGSSSSPARRAQARPEMCDRESPAPGQRRST